jgi:hypothetical protein
MKKQYAKIIGWGIPVLMFFVGAFAMWYKRGLLQSQNPDKTFIYIACGIAMFLGLLLVISAVPTIIKKLETNKGDRGNP